MKLLKPNLWVEKLSHIPLKELKTIGIKCLIIDIDNTLVAWDDPTPPPEAASWIKAAKDEGFAIILLSNNNQSRVHQVQAYLHVKGIARARKPFAPGLKKALRIMKARPVETAIIGDQIFTDVLGGNRQNLFTILVTPIKSKEFWWTTLMRRLEIHVLKSCTPFKKERAEHVRR